MARSYTTYDEYLKAAQQEAEQQQLAYAAARQQSADDTVAALTSAAARQQGVLQQKYRSQAAQTEEAYRALYDENAINERVARLNVEEAMANMGLTDSGLNRSQQTALGATRMRADAQTSAGKQAALDALLTSLNQALADSQQSLLERTADVRTEAQQDIEKHAQSLYDSATARSKAQFEADVDYVNALLGREKAEIEQATKQKAADAALQLQREKLAASLTQTQQRQSSGSSSSGSRSSSTSASDRAKNVQILQELLEKRVNIFNPEWRANYDELIDYYKDLVYNS